LRAAAWGTPCGEAVSLGMHESQSRGWENLVGRSRAFWQWCTPHAKNLMPDAMADQDVDSIYAAQNIIQPSFIRVESDEATYNLHIMLRFELERAMLNGDLNVDDIPARWNAAFKDYLGITVDKDANGCLQDVHWSHGLIGYFPTYTLGNLYASQLFEAAREQLGDLDAMFAKGEFEPLRVWLTQNIHEHGRRYSAAQLCERVTGKSLSAEPLMRHLEGKLRPIYGI
jgi:carboxypeptidase Taq